MYAVLPLHVANLQILAVLRPVNVGDRAGNTLTIADPLRPTVQGGQRVDVHTSIIRTHSQQVIIRTETEVQRGEGERDGGVNDREKGGERDGGAREREKGGERERERERCTCKPK